MKYDELIREYTPCPLCGSDEIEPWPHPPKDSVLKVVCNGCGGVFVSSKSDTNGSKEVRIK